MAESEQRGTIFISYSHKDVVWLERLKTQLKPLEQAGLLNVWDDRRIPAGAAWQEEINQALASASVAVLLVSPSFHASDFITKYELPALKEHTTILWVPISATVYRHTPLAAIQAAHDPDQPLDGLTPSKRNKALVAICEQIIDAYEKATQAKRFPEPIHSHNNLPAQVTSFIGREKEIAEVKNLLAASRLLTLSGSGGCGKTRLALHVAGDVLNDFPDGVWLVELASLADPALVPQTVARVLDVEEQVGQPIQQTLIEHLKLKHLLLILDNCEHLLNACAHLMAAILRTCPNVKVLATSRESLSIAGEQIYRVLSLPVPDPKQPRTLDSLSKYEGVRLFVERARLVRSDFTLSQQNVPAVAQICYRLEGIPLAIELAAAWVRTLSVESINLRLNNHFLKNPDPTAYDKDKTMHAVIEWSHDLLNSNERLLLSRLSVFAGGWTLNAAEQIGDLGRINEADVLDLLTSLVDKSLVIAEDGQGLVRYRMLETIRQYASERLQESSATEQAKCKHLVFFLALAEETEPKLKGQNPAQWLQRIEIEHDNLRAALEWCAVDAKRMEEGLRLGGAMSWFWYVRGYFSEGREHLVRVLGRKEAQAQTAVRAKALNGAGTLAQHQGDYEVAKELLYESLTIYRNLGGQVGKEGIGVVVGNLGDIAVQQGDYEVARPLHEESLDICTELGDNKGMAGSLTSLGTLAAYQGEFDRARALFEESLNIKRALGDRRGVGVTLNNLGILHCDQGDFDTARGLFEESLNIKRELGDRQGMAVTMCNLGDVDYYQGNDVAAWANYKESLNLSREVGDKRNIALSLASLGLVALNQGNYSEARTLFWDSLVLGREMGDRERIATAFEGLASVLSAQAVVQQAARLWGAAEALRQNIGAPLPPNEQEEYDQRVSHARAALGEEAFTAAWEEGRAMSWEQAVEYVLKESGD